MLPISNRPLGYVESPALGTISATSPTSDSKITILDWMDLYHPGKREALIQKLVHAFHEVGFVAFENVPVDIFTLDHAYNVSKAFFERSLEEKKGLSNPANSGERGYVYVESPQGSDPSVLDYKEFFHIGRENNLWPENSVMKESMTKLYQHFEELLPVVAEALGEALGEHPSVIADPLKNGEHLLRLIRYPKNPPNPLSLAAAHTDITMITILPKATKEGLQVQLKDGSWEDVKVPDNSIIINVGDMLQNRSNGFFRSANHRVISKDPNSERYSIVFFAHAKDQDAMDPLSSAIQKTGGQQLYPDIKRKWLLKERIISMGRASNEWIEEYAKSGAPEALIKYHRADPKVLKKLAEKGLASQVVQDELNKINK